MNHKIEALFESKTKWIWTNESLQNYNHFVSFRKSFDLSAVSCTSLKITADARYELYINGQWVGNGPVRSWPSSLPVDIYDITKYLNKGKNVVAIQVHHFGMGTNQYILGSPGLIAQIEFENNKKIGTDSSCKLCNNKAFAMPAPQVSIHQPWEEQFDASNLLYSPVDWRSIDYDDSRWDKATIIKHRSGSTLTKRPVPFLSREDISPKTIADSQVVRPADYVWSLNLRRYATDGGFGDLLYRSFLIQTCIYSSNPQTIELQDPHELSVWPTVVWKLNSKPVLGRQSRFDDPIMNWGDHRTVRVTLKKGWNILMGKHLPTSVIPRAVITIRADKPLLFAPEMDKKATVPSPWLIAGPFAPSEEEKLNFDKTMPDLRYPLNIHSEATSQRLEAIWDKGLFTHDVKSSFVKSVLSDDTAATDVFALCLSDKLIEKAAIKAENLNSLLCQNGEYAVIYPHSQGDVRLLIDFGKEVVGYHVFEIDAPAGTIVDVMNFEFIQPDGRKNLCEGMNNSFRYTCRQGYQAYRTYFRRGFRYSYVTLRNFKKPVKFYNIHALLNTYPFTYNGSFTCSDEKLNKIWQTGVHTLRCCSEDAYTDCPTFEQSFWVGDGRNAALVDFVVNGDSRLSAHSLLLAGQTLQRSDITESHAPSVWKNIIPAWSFLWMRWVQEHYQFTGDKRFARKMLGYVKKNIDGLKKYINALGLIQIRAWNLFDWAPMDTPSDGIVTHNNCLAVLAIRQCALMASQLGDKKLSEDWESLADSLTKAINKHLWSAAKKAYYDCLHADGCPSKVFSQQTHVAAYIANVPKGQRKVRCRSIIDTAPKGFVKAGSPFFMFFLLEVLANENQLNDMVKLVSDYWGLQTDAGADTFWEMYTPEANRLTRSHCHGWSAAPTFFLSHYILGIQPLEPGYFKVLIRPQIAGLSWARGKVPTPYGNIECRWIKHKDGFEIFVELPKLLPLRIEMPVAGKIIIVGKSSANIRKSKGRTWIDSDKEKKLRIRVN